MKDCSNEYAVKYSFNFGEKVAKFDYKRFMTSSNVESFFTNIPLNETINNCVEDLLPNNSYHWKFSQNDLCLYLRLTKIFGYARRIFYFENELYIQIDGVAMGSALSFIVVNAFLCHFQREGLQNWLLESKLHM